MNPKILNNLIYKVLNGEDDDSDMSMDSNKSKGWKRMSNLVDARRGTLKPKKLAFEGDGTSHYNVFNMMKFINFKTEYAIEEQNEEISPERKKK